MRNKLRCIIAMLCAALFITASFPISLLAEESNNTQDESAQSKCNFVQNLINQSDLQEIPNILQAAINSGDVYDISQLQKLYNLPEMKENSVYVVFILDDCTPVGATTYDISKACFGNLEIKGSELALPSGYALTNPSEVRNVEVLAGAGCTKVSAPSLIAFHVSPILPDPLPILKIKYVDDGTTIYTENKTLTNYEKTTIEANLQLLERLGYEIGETNESCESNILNLDLFESVFGDIQQETSYRVSLNDRIPLIPSDFLVWYQIGCLDIPFAISGNTLKIEVDKVRDVDSTINIVFQTKDGKQVGETTKMILDPLQDSLTVNKNNLPVLPVGYKLADVSESHTASWVNVDGVWSVSPKTLTFTVVSSLIDPITPVDTTRQPTVLGNAVTLSTSAIPVTADHNGPIVFWLVTVSLVAGAFVIRSIRRMKSI